MKLSIKVLAVIGLLALLAIIPLQMDDSLNPDIAELVEQVSAPQESQAYTFMMGFEAPADKDPLTLGGEKIARYENKKTRPEDRQPDEGGETIARPDPELFCSFHESQCLTALVDLSRDEAKAIAVLKNHLTLAKRFVEFLDMGDYWTPIRPALDEPLPDFSYSLAANRLVLLENMTLAHTDRTTAMAVLHQHVTALRQKLKQQDTLIGKVVFTVMVSESIDVLSLVAASGDTMGISLPPLAPAEQDYTLAFARELIGAYYLYQELDRNTAFFQEDGYTPGWVVRLLFKPNITINSAYPPYQQAIAYSQLSLPAFAEAMANHRAPEFPSSPIRNRAGDILNRVAIPDIPRYVAEVMDLGAKIALYNQLRETGFAVDREFANPYYPDRTAPVTRDGHYYCLQGPLEDRRYTRCLPLGLSL